MSQQEKDKETAEKEGGVLVPTEVQQDIILRGDPEKQLEYGKKSAQALMQVVSQKKKPVIIGGEQYIEFEDWQTLGRFFGATVGIAWTKPIKLEKENGFDNGWEAKAVVLLNGQEISSAEAMCLRSEKNWVNKDEFQLRSMAQTRASSKALRNVLAWVAVLAGYRPTPAEEMDGITPDKPKTPVKTTNGNGNGNGNGKGGVCNECGVNITPKVRDYSTDKYGRALCFNCQKEAGN